MSRPFLLLFCAVLSALFSCSTGDGNKPSDVGIEARVVPDVAFDQAGTETSMPDSRTADVVPDMPPDAAAPWPWPTCPEYASNGPSLAEKAQFLDDLVVQQHLPDNLLRTVILDDQGQPKVWLSLPSTGLWTASYMASQSLRYAATGDPQAQENAAMAARGLHDLTMVTGVPGLYGRSYQKPGIAYSGDVSGSPSWVASDAPGYEGWYWNHDVSKDTMDGLMFGYSVALEFLDDEETLDLIRLDITAFIDHLVGNGLQIIDHTGEVTEHGRLYHSAMDDFPGFNAILVASWIRVVLTETQDPELEHFYYDCLMRRGDWSDCPDIEVLDIGSYINSIEKAMSLYMADCQTNYDHFEMVFHATYPLLRREDDPELAARLAVVLENLIWNHNDPALDPPVHVSTHSFYTFLYGALSPPSSDDPIWMAAANDAVCTLYRLPQDRHQYAVPAGTQETACLNRHGRPNAADIIPLEERIYDNFIWRLDPYEIPEGITEVPGLVHSPDDYLVAYWLGRYYGFINDKM